MNTSLVVALILVVVSSGWAAKKNGGNKKCKAKALCPKVEALESKLNDVSAECQAKNEAQQKQINDLSHELEELKNRPPPTRAPTTEPPFACNGPWVEFQLSCYLFSDTRSKWAGAKAECSKYGAKLVSIKSHDEQAFVGSRLKGDSWLGMSDEANEGNWVWEIDGSALNYRHWNGGEPNGGRGENYGMIWSNGNWNDCGPNYDWYYICQKQ